MLNDDALIVSIRSLSSRQVICLALLHHLPQPAKTHEIRERGLAIGLREIRDWNLTDVLKRAASAGWLAQLPGGWKLLGPGVEKLHECGVSIDAPMVVETRHALRRHLADIGNEDRRRFLEEAIGCFEADHSRAAVVLSWVGAAHILQEHIVRSHLRAYNTVGAARFPKDFREVRSAKDFGTIGEADMLQLCQDAGMLDKAEKMELQARLDLRNRCGHPNSIKLAEHTVASHLEILLLNVYSKY